ncbi:MAG: serine/threonine protein kinase [Sandaracinaceae bacterium]
MGTHERQRTIMGIGMLDLPEELRSTLVDARPEPSDDDEPSVYRAWLGRVIDGKYKLESLIAEGGMGAVFEASPVSGGMPVAFKIMHPELGADGAIVKRFAREVEIGEKLTHDNVVAALDTGTADDGAPYLVLELVLGPTLSHAMWEDGAFEWRRAVKVASQIAGAIGAAWDGGFVHRDLKPDNVVLEPDGRRGEKVKLLDFGIAHDRSVAGVNAKLTVAGEVLGTMGYMAPEQAVGQQVDVRSDLYALGVLLWEMLAGFSLFDEDIAKQDYFLAQMRLDPTPTTELAPGSPPELDALVRELLKHLQSERPDDPWAVQATLLGLLEGAAAASPAEMAPIAQPAPKPMAPASDVATPTPPASPAPASPAPASPAPASPAPASPAPASPVQPAVRPGFATGHAPQASPRGTAPAGNAPAGTSRTLIIGGGILALFGGGMCLLAGLLILLR